MTFVGVSTLVVECRSIVAWLDNLLTSVTVVPPFGIRVAVESPSWSGLIGVGTQVVVVTMIEAAAEDGGNHSKEPWMRNTVAWPHTILLAFGLRLIERPVVI